VPRRERKEKGGQKFIPVDSDAAEDGFHHREAGKLVFYANDQPVLLRSGVFPFNSRFSYDFPYFYHVFVQDEHAGLIPSIFRTGSSSGMHCMTVLY